MENIIKQIKKGAKNTRLYVEEKAEMKSALVRHIKLNPVNEIAFSPHLIPSPFNINNFRNKKGISILVIICLLMGGTVSFAAESSVPGDALFSVKVYMNESVRGAVAMTPKAKADWEVKLVERRLEEVEKLAMTPDAPQEIQQVAERNLERYSERVKKRIEKFDENEDGDNAIETASRLSNVYNSHEQVLLDMNSSVGFVATRTITATATPVVAKSSLKNEKNNTTLKKVQVARDDAEKKHNELKEKYRNDKDDESEKDSSKISPKTSDKNENAKTHVEYNKYTPKIERMEEIRSTITNAKATSTPSVLETPEPKKEEYKKTDEKREEEER